MKEHQRPEGRVSAQDAALEDDTPLTPEELAEMEAMWSEFTAAEEDPEVTLAPPKAIQQDMSASAKGQKRMPVVAAVLTAVFVAMSAQMGFNNPTGAALTGGGAAALVAMGFLSLILGSRMGGLSRRAGVGLLVAGSLIFVALSGLMVAAVPEQEVPFSAWHCGALIAAWGLPAGALLVWGLWGVTLPTPLSGALLGAGVGCFSGMMLHLSCPMISPVHLLVHHGGGIVALILGGAAIAWGISRRTLSRGQ